MRWPFGPPHLTLKPSKKKHKKLTLFLSVCLSVFSFSTYLSSSLSLCPCVSISISLSLSLFWSLCLSILLFSPYWVLHEIENIKHQNSWSPFWGVLTRAKLGRVRFQNSPTWVFRKMRFLKNAPFCRKFRFWKCLHWKPPPPPPKKKKQKQNLCCYLFFCLAKIIVFCFAVSGVQNN